MKIHYELCDDGGSCAVWDIPFLLPIGTIFEHEFGTYKVTQYQFPDKPTDGIIACDRL